MRDGLRALEETTSSRARVHTFKVLNMILDHPTYLSEFPDRTKLFSQTLEDQFLLEDDRFSYSMKER